MFWRCALKGCHSCPFKAGVDAGVYENTPWEQVPCASCKLAEGGHSVEYDEERMEGLEGGVVDFTMSEPEESDLVDEMPVDVMREFVTGLLTLPGELRDVVALRYQGLKYDEIAKIQNVTMSCVEKRHRRAMELWPALRAMFSGKIAKQKKRKMAA
jgi:hypothetical protein